MATKLVFALLFCLSTSKGITQTSLLDLPRKARDMGLTFLLPRIDKLTFDTTQRGEFQSVDFSWRHTRGDFELRYRLFPDGLPETINPAVSSAALVVHCARNSAEDFVGRFRGGDDDLKRLGAEWVYFWDYAPKPSFSHYRRCYQASFYLSGRGLVHAWLLYNDADLMHSNWVYSVSFNPL